MGLLDRAREAIETRTGYAVRPRAIVDRLEENNVQLQQFRAEAAELAYWTMDYFGGRPQELATEKRARLAQRSRIAFMQDPLAGAEAHLLSNFSFGRGVGKPRARDEDVQQVIDTAWSDPVNEEKMTGFSAQRRFSNDLITQANYFDIAYVKGGRIRLGKLEHDTVRDIMPDPEDRNRPLYYIGVRRTYRWNTELDAPDITQELEEGREKVTYYAHWRNVDDAKRDRTENTGMEQIPDIPEEKKDPGEGLVYHTAINQLGEQLFGTPPWARSLRFYSAMNQFTEARVVMAQAASSFVAKRVLKGTPNEIVKSAGAILSQTGELGTSSFSDALPVEPTLGGATPFAPGAPPPVAPGSWFVENEQHKMESLSLQSGAAAAMQDSQIIRAPLAASSGFGQHYLGDASNANLATATTLELPTLMHVQAWQEVAEQRFRWFTDLAILAAIRTGKLGGIVRDEGDRPLAELWLNEQEDREELERRTGKDLTYSFEMPYPGRRNLPDVVNTFTQTLGVGGLGENPEMLEQMLVFLFTHGLQLEDPADTASKVMATQRKLIEERQAQAKEMHDVKKQAMAGDNPGGDESSVHGEKRRSEPPSDEMGEQEHLPPELQAQVEAFTKELEASFGAAVTDPAVALAQQLASSNGG